MPWTTVVKTGASEVCIWHGVLPGHCFQLIEINMTQRRELYNPFHCVKSTGNFPQDGNQTQSAAKAVGCFQSAMC